MASGYKTVELPEYHRREVDALVAAMYPGVPPNELYPELLGLSGINPFPGSDSSPRVQMLNSHTGQALVMENATIRRIQTGIEQELAKRTFKIKIPTNSQVIRVLNKYPQTLGMDAIKENPLRVVIYEDVETKEVGIVQLVRYRCSHQHFGFRYKQSAAATKLSPGAHIRGGTVLADTPNVDAMGNYKHGIGSNVVFMSLNGVIEDGVIACREHLQTMGVKRYETRVFSFGKNRFPLNTYGDDEVYKIHPDIGECVRDDGIIFASRSYNEALAAVEMTREALQIVDVDNDKPIYCLAGSKIIDVTVHHDNRAPNPPTPVGMAIQPRRYLSALSRFYGEVLEEYEKLRRRRGAGLKITPEFGSLINEALADSGESSSGWTSPQRVIRTYRRHPLDDYRIELTIENTYIPDVGAKITDYHGGKGVIVEVRNRCDMPTDANGRSADFIFDSISVVKRMNLGRLYEHYLNLTSSDISRKIDLAFGFNRKLPGLDKVPVIKQLLKAAPQALKDQCINQLMEYYKIVSPNMYVAMLRTDLEKHLEAVLDDEIYLYFPTDNPVDLMQMVRLLQKHYPVEIGPVTFRDHEGKYVITVGNFAIANMEIMLLEKNGEDWSGVGSSKLQVNGIPAKLTNADKYSTPGRGMPIRILGEGEVRLVNAVCGSDTSAELLDQSNSPMTHKGVCRAVATAEFPTNIQSVADRTLYPRGNSRALAYINHTLECAGVRFVYKPHSRDLLYKKKGV